MMNPVFLRKNYRLCQYFCEYFEDEYKYKKSNFLFFFTYFSVEGWGGRNENKLVAPVS